MRGVRLVIGVVALTVVVWACRVLLIESQDGSLLESNSGSEVSLHLYCAAGLRLPVEDIVALYHEEFGRVVHVSYAGSGALESQLKLAPGDLYLPADWSYIERTQAQGVVAESIPVSDLLPGVVLPVDSEISIQSLSDLSKPELRLSIGDESTAIGALTRQVLNQAGLWDVVSANVAVMKPTVNNVAEDVAMGAVDAGIVWEVIGSQFDELEFVSLPELEANTRRAAIGVLTKSTQPAEALHFARFLSSRDRGRVVFEKCGFAVPSNQTTDRWASVPTLTFFCESTLRPVIQSRVREFEEREGCRVATVFESPATLVSHIESGARPSAYFSCDKSFPDSVSAQFHDSETVSKTDVILLAAKGNPKRIDALADLGKDGLKVGLGNPDKSAQGGVVANALRRAGVWELLLNTKSVEVLAEGPELVSRMLAGELDTVLVYRSNILGASEVLTRCEVIEINDPMAFSSQCYAVARDTEFPQLARRLGLFLRNGDMMPARFERAGFEWIQPNGGVGE